MVELIYTYFNENQEIVNYLIKFAGNVVASTEKGLFGIISFLFFISTVFGLLFNIERAFNFVWKSDSNRPFHKKIMFYSLFLILSPLFIMLFLTLAMLYINTIDSLGFKDDERFQVDIRRNDDCILIKIALKNQNAIPAVT